MSLLGISFFIAMGLNSVILLFFMRDPVSRKVARRRLTTIQDSVRLPRVVGYGDDLEPHEGWSYSNRVGALLERYQFCNKVKVLLVHANSKMGVGGTALASAGCALVFGAAGFFGSRAVLPAAVSTFAGSAIPYCMLRFQRGRRVKAFNTALPDAIDLMSRSLLAGHSMGSSIELIAEQSPEPLAFEFVQVYQQQRLGLHFRDALLQMGFRVPSRDLQFLITAILVQKETGGDLTEILARASHVIRERIRIEGEVRTHTAQGRLTGWILALLPVFLLALLNLVSPGYSYILFHDPLGEKLLYSGGILILLGGLIIRKIVDIQV